MHSAPSASSQPCASYNQSSASCKRSGFTLVELLVVIAITGVLVGLLLPALQASRESSRAAQCRSQLRQVVLALLNYEGAHGHLPPGNFGRNPPMRATVNFQISERDHQLIGMIPLLLPYMEENSIYDSFGFDMLDIDAEPFGQLWILNFDTVEAARQTIPTVLCPSSLSHSTAEAELLFLNAYYNPKGSKLILESAPSRSEQQGRFGATNYLGSMGFFGNISPEYAQAFLGPIYTRSKTRLSEIEDGTSHTLAIGEAVGQQVDGQLLRAYSWMGCGSLPLGISFGDPQVWENFSSNHPSGVHVSFADGSTHIVKPDIDTEVLYAMGGIHDNKLLVVD